MIESCFKNIKKYYSKNYTYMALRIHICKNTYPNSRTVVKGHYLYDEHRNFYVLKGIKYRLDVIQATKNVHVEKL